MGRMGGDGSLQFLVIGPRDNTPRTAPAASLPMSPHLHQHLHLKPPPPPPPPQFTDFMYPTPPPLTPHLPQKHLRLLMQIVPPLPPRLHPSCIIPIRQHSRRRDPSREHIRIVQPVDVVGCCEGCVAVAGEAVEGYNTVVCVW